MAFLPVQWQAVVEKGRAVRASLGTGQLISLAAVFVAVVGLVIGSTWYLNRTEYRVLFSDLNAEEASRVVERLKADDVSYQLQDGGRTILVAADAMDSLKLQFAGEGMPTSGRIGFEIFDKVAFGQTEFLEHVNYRRALEGELARTIATLSEVESARIHIAMQKESLFGAREQPAKASVTLTLRGTRALPPQAAMAITNLVAASVEGLRPEQVVIIDSHGRSLARGAAGQDDGSLAGLELEKQQKFERDMSLRVVSLLEPVVGVDRVRVNVSARLHPESQERTIEEYAPETVLRSEQVTIEGASAAATSGIAGARANLPAPVQPDGTPAAPATPTATTGPGGAVTKSSKVSNYEITKTVTHTIRPRGEIAQVFVAVIVDDEHVTTTSADGTATTARKPRDPASMQKLEKLVSASLGIDVKRGDQITVENIAFEAPVAEPVTTPRWYSRVGEQGGGFARGLAVVVIVAMALLLFVRPVVGRLLTVSSAEHVSVNMPQQLPRTIEEIEGEIEAQLDAMPADGDRRQPVLTRRVSHLASKEPESAAKLVRGWLADGKGAR